MKNNRFLIVYFIVAILGGITSFYFYFKRGNPIEVFFSTMVFLDWVIFAAIAVITFKILSVFYIKSNIPLYLSLVPFITPILAIIGQTVEYGFFSKTFYSLGYLVECAILCFIILKISSKKALGLSISSSGSSSENLASTTTIEEALGQGNTSLDVVIRSLVSRAMGAQRMSTISLIFMVFILFVGGGASIGTTALDELKKVREIEIERNNLLMLKEKLVEFTEYKRFALTKRQDSTLKEIVTLIQDKFGNEKNYEAVLQKIEKRSQNIATGWQDLAMRISIAVLSLFLVQVFFHIYKFNQQQFSYLLARSEALQLFKDTPERDLKEMRSAVLAKMDVSPKFGKTPQSAIELALELINKGKGA